MYVQFMLWVPFYFCLRLFLCLPLSYLCLVLSVMCQKDMCVVSLVPVFVFCFCEKSTYADLSTVHFLFYFDSFLSHVHYVQFSSDSVQLFSPGVSTLPPSLLFVYIPCHVLPYTRAV